MSHILDTGKQSIYKEFDLGTFPIAFSTTTPWLQSLFIPEMDSYAKHLKEYYSPHYSGMFWDITELRASPVVHAKGRRFATEASVYDFLRTVCEENAGFFKNFVMARVYSNQSREIPVIGRMYGQNTLYSNLRGRRGYRDSSNYCMNPDTFGNGGAERWPGFVNFWAGLCNQNIGFPAGNVFTPHLNDPKTQAIWFSRSEQKKYGLPPRGNFVVNLPKTSRRYVYDLTDNLFISAPLIGYTNAMSPPFKDRSAIYAYMSVASAGSPIQWLSLSDDPVDQWLGSVHDTRLHISLNSESSGVIIYGLQDPTARYFSVLVKPFGIDKVGLDWFDHNIYDLYMLYYHSKDLSPRIRKIDLTTHHFPNLSNRVAGLSWIQKPMWMPPEFANRTARFNAKSSARTLPDYYFFLVDKNTGRAGLPSRNYIHPLRNVTNAPLLWEVRG